MKRLICAVIVSVFLIGNFFGQDNIKVRVGILNGPSAVPAAWLMKNNTSYDFSKYADPQALLPKMIKKEVDVGFFPVNLAAKVHNSSRGALICGAITGTGNLSLISTENVNRFSDLRNKKIYIAGQGATPEYIFRYLLKQNGYNPEKDISLDFSIPTAQIAANLISGKIKYAIVPEPFATIATSKSKNVKIVLDIQEEYKAFNNNGENYPLTVMVVRKDFVKENPELFEAFINDYKKSMEWTVDNPKAAGQLVEQLDLGLGGAIVTKSIPRANYVFIPAIEGKSRIEELLNIFLEYSPEAIGGSLPSQDFYYVKENSEL